MELRLLTFLFFNVKIEPNFHLKWIATYSVDSEYAGAGWRDFGSQSRSWFDFLIWDLLNFLIPFVGPFFDLEIASDLHHQLARDAEGAFEAVVGGASVWNN